MNGGSASGRTCTVCGAPVAGRARYCPACYRIREQALERARRARARAAAGLPPVGICWSCGGPVGEGGPQKQYCPRCAARRRREYLDTYRRQNTVTPAPDRPRKKRRRRGPGIEAVCRAADREGVSYGVYVQRHGL